MSNAQLFRLKASLSDYAKMILAFIRAHPGAKDFQIIWELHFDINRFQKALRELNENMLIRWQIEVIDDKFAKGEKISCFRLFPRL